MVDGEANELPPFIRMTVLTIAIRRSRTTRRVDWETGIIASTVSGSPGKAIQPA
jgi:hypothetical protein